MMSLPYAETTVSPSSAPVSGRSTTGSRDVTGMGIASVIHQVATQRVVARTASPAGESPSGSKNRSVTTNSSGPSTSPVTRAGV